MGVFTFFVVIGFIQINEGNTKLVRVVLTKDYDILLWVIKDIFIMLSQLSVALLYVKEHHMGTRARPYQIR